MKIGIVTYVNMPNYGAMLQAYAFQKYLQARGHHVVFIDYPWAKKLSLLKILVSRSLRSFQAKLSHNRSMKSFLSFQEHLKTTKRYESITSIRHEPPDCECFIVGSDQMWNVDICGQHNLPLVFLDIFGDNVMRVAYSVSFGRPIPEALREEIGVYMRKFKAIRVREKETVEWVHELSGKEAGWLCDPTLLWESEHYDELLPDVSIAPKPPYIFEYLLVPDQNIITQEIKKRLKIEHIKTDMCSANRWMDRQLGVRLKIGVGEWVQHIKQASFVVTNSFHGTLFSIIYKKPFLTLPLMGFHESKNSRIFSILRYLGLEKRIFNPTTFESLSEFLDEPIDWEDIDQRLAACRNKTDLFFNNVGL